VENDQQLDLLHWVMGLPEADAADAIFNRFSVNANNGAGQ
jgi:hypothetical protein